MRQLMSHYGEAKLLTILHLFPLPYHSNAFTAAHGAAIIKSYNGTDAAVLAWADALYGGAQAVRGRVGRAETPLTNNGLKRR